MARTARNAECPCGSGRKYKRCCLSEEERQARVAQLESRVGERIADWSLRQHGDELDAALAEFFAGGEPLGGRGPDVALTWFISDRELDGGWTPAERYAALPGLDPEERSVASRIAGARLGLHRVRAASPGGWIDLEGAFTGKTCRVASHLVSHEVARWDILLCRVMAGEPLPSLWGPGVAFHPDEELELLQEIERAATEHGLPADPRGLEAACRAGALELFRFVPPSRRVEPTLFTAEGDPVVLARAVWRLADPEAAFFALDAPPELLWVGESEDGAGDTFQLTGDRAELLARRPPLPPGALCFESSYSGLPDRIGLGTFVLGDSELAFDAISEARLAFAQQLVVQRLGDGAELVEREVAPLRHDAARAERRAPPLAGPGARELEAELLGAHLSRWLDDPLECLGGATPRQAAADPGLHGELELLLRGIENRADRAERNGQVWPEVGWLREELGLRDQLAA